MVIAAGFLRGLFVIAQAVKSPGRQQSLSLGFTLSVCIGSNLESIHDGPSEDVIRFCHTQTLLWLNGNTEMNSGGLSLDCDHLKAFCDKQQ